ncbi:MAG: hypothetical protein IJ489_01365 [Clostridia bacterium]|nr:hypothetical protein [Clostridia bacterium]
MKVFENAKWIWCSESPRADEYGEFYSSFQYNGGEISVSISADSNYALYLNGIQVSFGQYADYPYDKIYDTIDLKPFCRQGENHLAIVVWYYGIDTTSVYYPGNAGLIFDVVCDGVSVCVSSEKTDSRMSSAYSSHRKKIITGQMGLSFFYDATKEDDWKTGILNGFSGSVIVDQNLPLRICPVEKLKLEKSVCGQLLKKISDTDSVFDLGIHTVGFLQIETDSDEEQTLVVSYAEHLTDDVVQRKISSRDFSVEIRVKKGKTVYMNPFRRLAAVYLEVQSEYGLNDIQIAIVPTIYPVEEKKRPVLTKAQSEIYDISVRALKHCMHEHYEDCPWREQALYCMDSRNQMLFGYYAFGETRFPRANLELISKDDREDGLLSICFPIKMDLVIPSFSLHWFTSCAEYLRYSGDTAFLREIYPKLKSVLSVFLSRMEREGDLVLPFEGKQYWNFYEWSDGLDEKEFFSSRFVRHIEYDLILNTLLSLALQRMAEIASALSIENRYLEIAEKLNGSIRNYFYSAEKEMFFDRYSNKKYSILGNSLAILCGACEERKREELCEKILSDHSLTQLSLSMKCFLYDTLLVVDREKYRDFILADIEKIYRPMVECGVGTVWETENGWRDFADAGSLCHGWSALPIYYYHILL